MDKLFTIIGFVGLIVFIGLVMSLPTWLLWNACLLPAIDGLHEISWLQAWGINILFAGWFKTTVSQK